MRQDLAKPDLDFRSTDTGEIINMHCFKPLSFGIICDAARNKKFDLSTFWFMDNTFCFIHMKSLPN